MLGSILTGLLAATPAHGFRQPFDEAAICSSDLVALVKVQERTSAWGWLGEMKTVKSVAKTTALHVVHESLQDGADLYLRTYGGRLTLQNGSVMDVEVSEFPVLEPGVHYTVFLRLGIAPDGHPTFVKFYRFAPDETLPTNEEMDSEWEAHCG